MMTPYDGDDLPPLDQAAVDRIQTALARANALLGTAQREGSPAVRGRIEWDVERQITAILPASEQAIFIGEAKPDHEGPRGAPTED